MELLTDCTVGAVVSMTSALLPAGNRCWRAGSVRAALLPTLSWMVAPLRASEVVAV